MFDNPLISGGLTLDPDDLALLAVARTVLLRHYHPSRHMVGCALRGHDGRIWTGLHLHTTVGRLAVCAEAVALGRAVLEGDGRIASIVAVRHPKPDEEDRTLAVVAPCGGCRELVVDYDPDAWVIVPGPEGAFKLPARALLPLPYRR